MEQESTNSDEFSNDNSNQEHVSHNIESMKQETTASDEFTNNNPNSCEEDDETTEPEMNSFQGEVEEARSRILRILGKYLDTWPKI